MDSIVTGPIRYEPVGQCIYCDAAGSSLSDEHIIPYGLQGEWVLPQASCSACAKITGRFERTLLRGDWLAARSALGLRTRRPRSRPDNFEMFLRTAGSERKIQAPSETNFAIVPLPIFPLPRTMSPEPETLTGGGIALEGIYVGYTAPPTGVLEAHSPAESMATIVSLHASEFARLIAKIAHGVAIATYGIGRIANPVLPEVILGHDSDIGRWVGTLARDPFPVSLGVLHCARPMWTNRGLVVAIQLFTWQPSPTYVAIVTESPIVDSA